MERDGDDLDKKFDKVFKDKKDLEERFNQITQEIKQHAEVQNIYLTGRLKDLMDHLISKVFSV